MTPKQRSFAIYSVAALLLIVPLIGMQFSKEIKWSLLDFIIAGFLLFTTAFSIDSIMRRVKTKAYQFITIALVLITLFLIWAELAVGIFGTPLAGN
ncbi:hypothetical protein [Elizabethkingia anophelis]|uniref:Uncharacterized protein n=2 Tax=Elizabethkingia anophelis TaxID=1117645 RepID=A0AAE4P2I3_9FLAO|nr:hypothetical protein [Elizabethkingia anophelis]AIL47208.1 hypothetical protein BD94_3433 [Elizabethkingia anophelis NUHP1]AQW94395.1 hypothetical protein BBD30_09390 [Elizabethkingia anophelis]AQX00832.1 hypothetical protein BBD32_04865 [Elizabethkingia anophelis]KFC40068.1 membrane protein [Elizabethkingia anophelis]KGT09755.1 membrane protein [Elizabethkingia anophelis]